MKIFIIVFSAFFIFLFSCTKDSPNSLNPSNHPPVIDSVSVVFDLIQIVPIGYITCYAHDVDGDSLYYKWRASAGEFQGKGKSVKYIIPPCCDSIWNQITVEVFDIYGASAKHSFQIKAPRK